MYISFLFYLSYVLILLWSFLFNIYCFVVHACEIIAEKTWASFFSYTFLRLFFIPCQPLFLPLPLLPHLSFDTPPFIITSISFCPSVTFHSFLHCLLFISYPSPSPPPRVLASPSSSHNRSVETRQMTVASRTYNSFLPALPWPSPPLRPVLTPWISLNLPPSPPLPPITYASLTFPHPSP